MALRKDCAMSKNGKGKGRKSRPVEGADQPSDNSPAATPPANAAPRQRLTIPERLAAKSENVHERIKDVLKMATFYGISQELLVSLQQLLVDADACRGKVSEIIEAGWEPVSKANLKEISTGTKIAIAADFQKAYSFIPSDVKLAVAEIARSENGRVKRILLTDERVFDEGGAPSGAPSVFGWALLAHIERR
jgi:hypothetical protein